MQLIDENVTFKSKFHKREYERMERRSSFGAIIFFRVLLGFELTWRESCLLSCWKCWALLCKGPSGNRIWSSTPPLCWSCMCECSVNFECILKDTHRSPSRRETRLSSERDWSSAAVRLSETMKRESSLPELRTLTNFLRASKKSSGPVV